MDPTTPINDLQQFIALLEATGELARIAVAADPILEIAAITDHVCKQPDGGKALFFEHPRGASVPLATNLFGSTRRVCQALGVTRLDALTERLAHLLNLIPDPEVGSLDRQIANLPAFMAFAPSPATAPDPDLLAMASPDLTRFPFLHNWPGDGAVAGHPRYITLPQVFTAAPDGSAPNCGMYRCQVRGPRELAIRWHQGSGGARHLEAYRRRQQQMPVAIVLGGPPAALFSALFPLPGDLDEMAFAGFLRNGPIAMAACRTLPLAVPAAVELLIEGYVDPAVTVTEGPFGNHTGSYSPAGPAATMTVTAIGHRTAAVVPATVVGPPPMEDCWMAKAWERLLLAFLQRLVPGIADVRFPLEWIFHQSAIISLDHPTPAMVRETAERLWATPWFSAARLLLFIDAASPAAGFSDVAWHAINLTEFSHDVFQDHSGRRLALDATGSRVPLCRIARDDGTRQLVHRRWQEYGLD